MSAPRPLRWLVDALSSFWLSCTLLLLLAVLTWLGTLEQVHTGLFEVQKQYFESLYVIHHAGPFAIPLPGAMLVMAVLCVNLVLGGSAAYRTQLFLYLKASGLERLDSSNLWTGVDSPEAVKA